MRTLIIKYAFTAAIICFSWTLIEHIAGFNSNRHDIGEYTRLFPVIIYYILIIAAIKRYKAQLAGYISFKDAFKVGIGVSFLYAFLATCWFTFYAEVINTEFQETLSGFEQSKLLHRGATSKEVATSVRDFELTSGGSLLSYLILFFYLFISGSLLAFFTSLIIKKERPY
jgi:Protein of unknown function (DUF4199)